MQKTAAALLCFGTTLAMNAAAQTVTKPDGQWRGSFGAGVTNSTGNISSLNASGNADVARKREYDNFVAYLQGLYGRTEEDGMRELVASLLRTGVRYDRDFSDLTYGFAGYDGEKNKLADLQWRHAPSIGAGLHLRRTENYTFDVFAGYSHNREELYVGPTRSFDEGLFGEETTHRFSGGASFRQRLTWYPNLSDSGEYRLVFDAGLVAPVVDRLSVTLTYSLRYQSNPPAGVDKKDTTLFAGLQYSWGPK
jgi:putative salt-induced outer membrane protein YdiY